MVKGRKQSKETEELKNQLARALADYDNFRKRVERERELNEKLANLKFILKLLPVLDMLKDAQRHLKDKGIELTIKTFGETLDAEGIEEIVTEAGDEFDPSMHEVTEVIPGTDENKISEVMLSGYRYKEGPVIRHAKVKVIKGK
ncbi:nucleotide exchange factor GrpE [Patescibacteria group bacterium]|nr:nucleotide exchange factor GrpE [Patescibacteria group bacterium]